MANSPRPTAAEVRGFPFLSGLSDAEVDQLIAGSRRLQIQPPAALITEGERDDRLFLIISGELSVRSGGRQIAVLGPGDSAGEISATPINHTFRRTATVQAATTAELIELPAELIQRLLAVHSPIRAHFASLRARRLSFEALTRHVER